MWILFTFLNLHRVWVCCRKETPRAIIYIGKNVIDYRSNEILAVVAKPICSKFSPWIFKFWLCILCSSRLGIKKNWKLVKILLVLIIFYKMNTDNNTLLKFYFIYLLITKQVQSCNLQEDGIFFHIWICFVIKWLSEIKIWVKHHYQY